MMPAPTRNRIDGPTPRPDPEGYDYDVVVLGAGMSGLCQLYHLQRLGLSVKAFDDAADVGGTWYWNRYPGCRFDSESESYSFSFSQELLDEWYWKEHFSSQPENLKYCQYVAKKFELYKFIQFNTRISSAHWQEGSRTWKLTAAKSGEQVTCRFLITAVGPLSAPTLPSDLDITQYKGESCHTANWPLTPVTFEGKRVAVIGTGATGIQAIQEVAKTAKHLTVFQRSPNWSCPLGNSPVSEEKMKQIRKNYPSMFKKCTETQGCFVHDGDPRSVFDVTPEERDALWETLYAAPGMGMWVGNFRDLLVDPKANELVSTFVANKVRSRVKDPVTAEKLIPKHGFGLKRLPLETNYFEVYNQTNVELVSLLDTPIDCVTEKGIRTRDDIEREFDMMIYATGFDALTGAFDRINIRGVGGETLKDRWTPSPQTYLGLMVDKYPNMMMVFGPHGGIGNAVPVIEFNVDWITKLLSFAKDKHLTRLEATKEKVDEWTKHVNDSGANILGSDVDSWVTGVNRNVGKTTRIVARYVGGNVDYRQRVTKAADNDFRDLYLS
jgi:cation diffusion facilitator CzcD-associated flavoprotein CzcO